MFIINALAVADSVVIPTQYYYISAKAIELLLYSGLRSDYDKINRIGGLTVFL